jgi:hypothetical protein
MKYSDKQKDRFPTPQELQEIGKDRQRDWNRICEPIRPWEGLEKEKTISAAGLLGSRD